MYRSACWHRCRAGVLRGIAKIADIADMLETPGGFLWLIKYLIDHKPPFLSLSLSLRATDRRRRY